MQVNFSQGIGTSAIEVKVTTNHFGISLRNTGQELDENGIASFEAGKLPMVIETVGSNILRYPGGTVTEDHFYLNDPYATETPGRLSGEVKATVPLDKFLEFCDSNGQRAVIVIPTLPYFERGGGLDNVTTGAHRDEIKQFVRDLLSGDYAHLIEAFEIGNEWYVLQEGSVKNPDGWKVDEFGELQSLIAKFIDQVQQEDGSYADPKILVQAGRNDTDDQTIRDQFTTTELAVVDGVVRHTYITPPQGGSNPLHMQPKHWEQDTDGDGDVDDDDSDWATYSKVNTAWDSFAGRNIEVSITEWNVASADDTAIKGLMRTPALLRQFSEMIENRIELATIFISDSNSEAALHDRNLGGDADDFLTPTGYFFRMLTESLPGTRLVDHQDNFLFQDSAGNEVGLSYTFQSDGKTVIFISSGVAQSLELSANFDHLIGNGTHVSGTILGAKSGTSATAFDAFGQLEHLDEDTLRTSNGDFSITLNAYEMIRITFDDLAYADNRGVKLYGDDQNNVNDHIVGSAAKDNLIGNGGGDLLQGGNSRDWLSGSAGKDILEGDDSADTLWGGDGNDVLKGGDGKDKISGDSDQDELFGQNGNDKLFGGDGNDTVNGGSDQDAIYGGQGHDILSGNKGNDTLIGGSGDDTLHGGNSNDTFVFAGGSGDDVVTDLLNGDDSVDLSAYSFADTAQLQAATAQQGSDLLLDLEPGSSVLFQDITWIALEEVLIL